ncbi:MAG: hypothetical protein H7176_08195, partial [Bdellovibrionales bacterium]|nr:hypothetical protein [Massilia sp.]
GSFKSKFSKLDIVLHGFGESPALKLNGKALATTQRSMGFVDGETAQVKVSSTIMNNDSSSFVIGF